MAASQRQLRVGELVRHALSDILSRGDVRDPGLAGKVITVPEVRMSPDLKVATVLVVPLGGEDTDAVLAGLERERRHIRGELARRVKLKFAPEVRFVPDTRFDDADRIDELLASPAVRRDLKENDEDV